MEKLARTYRLHPETIDQIDNIADREGVSRAQVIERAVAMLHVQKKGMGGEAPSTVEPATAAAIDALVAQLAAKDEQIAALTAALASSQDISKAAQALNAASLQKLPIPESAPEPAEPKPWWRFWD